MLHLMTECCRIYLYFRDLQQLRELSLQRHVNVLLLPLYNLYEAASWHNQDAVACRSAD